MKPGNLSAPIAREAVLIPESLARLRDESGKHHKLLSSEKYFFAHFTIANHREPATDN